MCDVPNIKARGYRIFANGSVRATKKHEIQRASNAPFLFCELRERYFSWNENNTKSNTLYCELREGYFSWNEQKCCYPLDVLESETPHICFVSRVSSLNPRVAC